MIQIKLNRTYLLKTGQKATVITCGDYFVKIYRGKSTDIETVPVRTFMKEVAKREKRRKWSAEC